MKKSDIEAMASGLDHAAMSAMEIENRRLKNINAELLAALGSIVKKNGNRYTYDRDEAYNIAFNTIAKSEK